MRGIRIASPCLFDPVSAVQYRIANQNDSSVNVAKGRGIPTINRITNMKEYHKIQTVFKRDESNKHKTLLEGQYSLPCFEYLKNNEWVFTEKVDGTNIRVMQQEGETTGLVSYGGKTDAAQIPATLIERLRNMFDSKGVVMKEAFPHGVCLYGEGYGAKIQKGGGNYGPSQDFVLFDVKIGHWWLERESVEEVALKLGLRIVPIIGKGTIDDMISMAKQGFKSTWGDFEAEGIVARPSVEMFTRNLQRIITKIKMRDFVAPK